MTNLIKATLFLLLLTQCDSVKEIKDKLNKFLPPGEVEEEYQSNAKAYFKSSDTITTYIFYFDGSEPYDSEWDLFKENMDEIFKYRTTVPTVNTPASLSETQSIGTTSETEWTIQKVLDLNKRYGEPAFFEGEAKFNIYFLPGYYFKGGAAQKQVIGFNITGTNVIAIFKEVIKSTRGLPGDPTPYYVEKGTLIHEMGHALGFVNNGVPLATEHQDVENGSHTKNDECIMYWQNEGPSSASDFIQKYITGNNKIMWGPEVLQDAESFSE